MHSFFSMKWYVASMIIVLCGCVNQSFSMSPFTEEGVTALMQKVNDHTKANPWTDTDRNWIRATYYTGVIGAYHATKDPAYLEQAMDWAKKHQWQVGTESSGSNKLFCAMTWAELYLIDPDQKKIEPTLQWLATDAPNSPSGAKVWYGHGPAPHDKPLYSDSLYGAPVFAMLYKATGKQKYLDILNDFFWNVTNTLLDKDEDLYYRDPSYIRKKTPHGKKILWSRGNGWVFAAIPRILTYLPKDVPYYERYVSLYKRMAKTLASRQHEDGLWRSNLGDPDHYLMPESSGTAFFIFAIAWGINQGILNQETYLPIVIKGWNGLVNSVLPNGTLGWVQPVDGQPRPSLPYTTHEYAVGLFLLAGGEVLKLVQSGVIQNNDVAECLQDSGTILPPAILSKETLDPSNHPLADKINTFLDRQPKVNHFKITGLSKNNYLDVIAGQVKIMASYQNDEGRIIDPVTSAEMYYSTPCYAHSVAVLAKTGYPISKELVESGIKALDVSLKDLAAGKTAGGHGDFFTWPIVFAYELLETFVTPERKDTWSQRLAAIEPVRSYRVFREPVQPNEYGNFYSTYGSSFANNWNLVNTAGEFARYQNGFTDLHYVDYCLTMQLCHFTPYGMYNEGGNPLPYDLFVRHYITGMLHRGYRSSVYTTYRDILWRGAWTSLLMQSPFGELPTGFRSSHHIWNEAEQAVIFEVYASQYAKAGKMVEAGAFKRAARLSLASIKDWIRPDGSGYAVKNRYPVEAKHGYEGYTAHTCYNMLACSILAQAWQFADESIEERPCPADVGGFAFAVPEFHKVFANAGGTYIEYDTNGDLKYNPTGLLRIHLKDGYPQLGPSDGCAAMFSGEGNYFAVGPAWKDTNGNWVKLAKLKNLNPTIEVIEESPGKVRFKVACQIDVKDSPQIKVSETFTVKPDEVLIENHVQGAGISQLRVYYPMLVFDGEDETDVQLDQNSVQLKLKGKCVCFEILGHQDAKPIRLGQRLNHRNGVVEPVYFDVNGTSARYRISTACQ